MYIVFTFAHVMMYTDLEDGEILSTVKLEPQTSDDEHRANISVGRRRKRFFSSSPPHSYREVNSESLRLGIDGIDDVSSAREQTSGNVIGPVTRNSNKQRRSSKDTTSPGQPGVTAVATVLYVILCVHIANLSVVISYLFVLVPVISRRF